MSDDAQRTLAFLLSGAMPGSLAPEHRADLERSGLTDATIRAQKIRSVPPAMIDRLLGFEMPKVMSAYLLPFADPAGGFMAHIRMKVFPSITTNTGTIKYLQPRGSGVRIYFPLATLDAVLNSAAPLYVVEGEKKALSVSQLGHPAIGISGIECWNLAGSRDLHPDLADVSLRAREINVLPDGDWRTNPAVNRAVQYLAAALEHRGARPNVITLTEVAA